MKILHTADWHIGQSFHEYDRTYEHQQFLSWLVDTIQELQVDVMLISGDIFDLSNPSAASVKMFYSFLNKAVRAMPNLQIIVTAGNHDSASRLESPKPLLESSNIHIIGLIEKKADGNIDYEKLIVPIKDKSGTISTWFMAVPFLRMGDYPVIANMENPYAEGVSSFYKNAYEYALTKKQAGQAIIAMGHLHAQQAEVTDLDKAERLIMGGVECISAAAFHKDIAYVALGHIHKAQRIGGVEHIRYSGSPIPMSFSEINYKHQLIVFDLEDESINNLKSVEIPVSVALLRVPSVHSSLIELINTLQQLPATGINPQIAPYLEVRVLLEGPEPGLRHKIESILSGKDVRLAKIDVRYHSNDSVSDNKSIVVENNLNELQPKDLFEKVYQSKYNNPVPLEMLQLFNQASQELSQSEA